MFNQHRCYKYQCRKFPCIDSLSQCPVKQSFSQPMKIVVHYLYTQLPAILSMFAAILCGWNKTSHMIWNSVDISPGGWGDRRRSRVHPPMKFIDDDLFFYVWSRLEMAVSKSWRTVFDRVNWCRGWFRTHRPHSAFVYSSRSDSWRRQLSWLNPKSACKAHHADYVREY